MTKIVRQDVERLPQEPLESILYVSQEHEITMHLCACGCGHKVVTFLGDGHQVYGDNEFPTVLPSIGVWDAKCRSHYFIDSGKILWANKFSEAEIASSMRKQLARHVASSGKHTPKNVPWYVRVYRRIFK